MIRFVQGCAKRLLPRALETKPLINGSILEPVRDHFRDVKLALVYRPYGRKQFAPKHIFMKIRLRAERQGPPDAIFVVQSADHNEPGLRRFSPNPLKHFLSAYDWQVPIKEQHIRSEFSELFYGCLSIASFPHHNHVRLRIDYGGDAFPHPGVIVNDEDAYLS
jgi:hypothetical protein